MKRVILFAAWMLVSSGGLAQDSHHTDGISSLSSPNSYTVYFRHDNGGNVCFKNYRFSSLGHATNGDDYEDNEYMSLVDEADISISVNKSWSHFRISILGNLKSAESKNTLQVYNINGMLLYKANIEGNVFSIDLSSLKRQMYIFHICINDKYRSYKFSKNNKP